MSVLDEIDEAERRATEKPWAACEEAIGAINGPDCVVAMSARRMEGIDDPDARLIVLMRNHIRALVECVRAADALHVAIEGNHSNVYERADRYADARAKLDGEG